MSNPKLYIIAGPNGSGKPTFVLRFLPYDADCINFVNADLIALGLSPFSPEVAAIKAGKLMLDEIDAFRNQRADFAFETTLAGNSEPWREVRSAINSTRIGVFMLDLARALAAE